MSFARYKGLAENYLISLNLGGLHVFRPGYIYPVEKRQESNLAYRIYRKLFPVLNKLMSFSLITSELLAKSMLQADLNGTEKIVLGNKYIKEEM